MPMRFLVVTDDSQVSQENTLRRVDTNQHWVAESRKSGALEAIYSLAGNNGVAMILNVESPESLDRVMIGMAACDGTTLHIQALADYDVAMKHLGDHFKSALAAMKSKS
jgi:hypothetical protein